MLLSNAAASIQSCTAKLCSTPWALQSGLYIHNPSPDKNCDQTHSLQQLVVSISPTSFFTSSERNSERFATEFLHCDFFCFAELVFEKELLWFPRGWFSVSCSSHGEIWAGFEGLGLLAFYCCSCCCRICRRTAAWGFCSSCISKLDDKLECEILRWWSRGLVLQFSSTLRRLYSSHPCLWAVLRRLAVVRTRHLRVSFFRCHRRDHACKVFCKDLHSAVENPLVFQEFEAGPIVALLLLLLFLFPPPAPANMNLSACVFVLLTLTTVSGLRTPVACQASWASSTPLWIFSDFWVGAHSVLPPLFCRNWPTPGLTRMELCCDRALLRSSTLTILPLSLTLLSKYEKVSMALWSRSLQLQFRPSVSRTPTVATFSERRELLLLLTRQKLVQILAHYVPWRNASKGSHLFLRMRIWSIVASQLLHSRNFLP